MRQPSDLTCVEQGATAVKLAILTEHTTVCKAKSVPTAGSSMHAFESADVIHPSASNAVHTADCTSSYGECLASLVSPCTHSSCSKPVDGDRYRNHDTSASLVDSDLSNAVAAVTDVSKTLSIHSPGDNVGHGSSGSDEVFLINCSQNSFTGPVVEPLSSDVCATVPQHNGQNAPLTSNTADGAIECEQMHASKAFGVFPLQQLRCSLFDDIFHSSSSSDSESEPLGGCKEALLNPDHCISDLCLDDNDDESVFGATGFQSPPATDSPRNRNKSTADDPVLFSARHGRALSDVSNRIKLDRINLLDLSKLDVSSFSDSYRRKSHMQLNGSASAFDETQMNRSASSITNNSRFRSPPRSSVCDEPTVYSCTVPLNNNSPFRSPPKSSKSKWNRTAPVEERRMLETVMMLSADDATCCAAGVVTATESVTNCRSSPDVSDDRQLTEVSESARDDGAGPSTCDETSVNGTAAMEPADIVVPTACGKHSQNTVAEKDMTVIAISDSVLKSSSSALEDHYDNWMPASPVVAVGGNSTETLTNEVNCNRSESGVCCPRVEIKCSDGSLLHSSPCRDVDSMDSKGRQTSVKQLKCKFESQQDVVPQSAMRRSSENFALAFVPSTLESNTSRKLQRDCTHSAYPDTKSLEDISHSEINNITSADSPSSNGVRHCVTEQNLDRDSSTSVCKTAADSVRDFKQCRQPSVSARISCFEPVMSESAAGCQKETKRARLSSCGSAAVDRPDTKLNCMSHSVKEPFNRTRQTDADGWFVESPQCSHAKQYHRCSSAGHEDLLALLNIPAASAKNIPRVSERKRMFEMEAAVPKVHSSDSLSSVSCRSPAFDCSQYTCAPQRLWSLDKENSLRGYETNSRGRVNSRRSLFEGNSACTVRNDSVDSDSSAEVDCRSFKYPVNRIKTKNRCLQTTLPTGSVG